MVKRLFDKLRWHSGKSLDGVEVTYIHRGAPGDTISIQAKSIVSFEKSFFTVLRNNRETSIPYHRISEIRNGDEILWKKRCTQK